MRNCNCKSFAKNNGLKIVSIPYLLGVYNPLDDGFSKDLFPVGPIEFLNLILHARYVLTDSFTLCCSRFFLVKDSECLDEAAERII